MTNRKYYSLMLTLGEIVLRKKLKMKNKADSKEWTELILCHTFNRNEMNEYINNWLDSEYKEEKENERKCSSIMR